MTVKKFLDFIVSEVAGYNSKPGDSDPDEASKQTKAEVRKKSVQEIQKKLDGMKKHVETLEAMKKAILADSLDGLPETKVSDPSVLFQDLPSPTIMFRRKEKEAHEFRLVFNGTKFELKVRY